MVELKHRRILITGAAGFLGSNLTRELLQNGAEVHALVRPDSNLWRIQEIIPAITIHRVDLTDNTKLRAVIQYANPEVIFHTAAQGVSSKHQIEREMLNTNITGTFNLLEATAKLDYQLFVHIGGSSEYGTKGEPMQESQHLEPLTFYGTTKAAATLLCQQFARANRRPVVVLRPFSIYGYWESPSRLIPTAIKSALLNQELSLTSPGYRRDFIFIEDLVEACLFTLKTKDIFTGEIINIGSGVQWSNEEVVEIIQDLSGQRINLKVGDYPVRLSDKTHWVAHIQKAQQLLNWKPRHTLRTGLKKTIDWLRHHQEYYLMQIKL